MKKSPLKRVSKKRAKELSQYFKLRKEFLEDRMICQICGGRESTQIHHTNGRGMERLNKKEFWLATCSECHQYVHDHPEAAMKAGWLLQRKDNL